MVVKYSLCLLSLINVIFITTFLKLCYSNVNWFRSTYLIIKKFVSLSVVWNKIIKHYSLCDRTALVITINQTFLIKKKLILIYRYSEEAKDDTVLEIKDNVLLGAKNSTEIESCVCGVFLSGQFKRGSPPNGPPVLLHEYDENFMCSPLGNKQCTNKCLEVVSIFKSILPFQLKC